jgi:hypothetical protein
MSDHFKLRWPVDSRVITQRFGENPHIYAKFNMAGHEGLDFSASIGSNIYAGAAGEVFEVRPNDGNAYGLHVRIRHPVDGQEYRTIYAHLSQALVAEGDWVEAGERIALSGNTGHTFGPHLHLTLKRLGAQTPGYPNGVIDPLPYLQLSTTPEPSDLTLYPTERLRLRALPTTDSAQLAWLAEGEPLTVLGDADEARAQVGVYGEWIQVQRAGGLTGFAAAWYLQREPPAAPPEPAEEPKEVVVYAMEPLNVRLGPSTGSSRVAIALPHEPLAILEDAQAALAALGDRGAWLRVRLPHGQRGYVAAWYVQAEPGLPPHAPFTVYPREDMNFRERPTVRAERIGRLARNTPLAVHDDRDRAQALVGRYDEWLYVEDPEGQRGWVAAWYVSPSPT